MLLILLVGGAYNGTWAVRVIKLCQSSEPYPVSSTEMKSVLLVCLLLLSVSVYAQLNCDNVSDGDRNLTVPVLGMCFV